jgi:predicted Zn-dependent protease
VRPETGSEIINLTGSLVNRPALLIAALTALLVLASASCPAQALQKNSPEHYSLPDLGSPSDKVLSPRKEAEYGRQVLSQIREYDLLVTDPLVRDYIYHLGYRLAAHSDKPGQAFHFNVIKEPSINAFAVPGGYIFVHSGLFLMTDNESELAGVLSHEIAHITQRHSSRTLADMTKVSVPILLGMVGALIASKGNGNASQAIIASGLGLQQQLAINFTRDHEHEADRLGITTLAKSRLNPQGMADFFGKMLRKYRITDERYQLPEFLRTHPLSVTRVSEAKNRAQKIQSGEINESPLYDFVKERLRVLTARNPMQGLNYYQGLTAPLSPAQNYGFAYALLQNNQPEEALRRLKNIPSQPETALAIDSLKAEALSYLDFGAADRLFSQLAEQHDQHPVVLVPWIHALMRSGKQTKANKARKLARELTVSHPQEPDYFALLAVANQNAKRPVEATEAKAHERHLTGHNYQAVQMLRNLLRKRLDYYQRARITSRIHQYEQLITERERQNELSSQRRPRG